MAGPLLMAVILNAAPATAPPQPTAAEWQAYLARRQAQMQAFYPAKAAAAGVQGEAMLSCDRTDKAALVNCRVVAERPLEAGFGAAALQIAAQADGASSLTGAQRTGEVFTVQFRLNPMVVGPEIAAHPHMITNPNWQTKPTAEEFMAVYPKAAQAANVGGAATLNCRVRYDGHLTDCTAKDEPDGMGFGAAALSLAPYFLMKPMAMDGLPISGGRINVPIRFALPAPAAK